MRAGDQRLGVVAVGRRSPGCSFSSVASVSDARIRRSAAFATPVSSGAGSRLHACRPALPPRHWPRSGARSRDMRPRHTRSSTIPTRASERRSRRTCECCGQRKKRAGAGSWSWRTPTGARSCSQRCTRRNPGVPAGTAYAQGRLSEEINGSLRAPNRPGETARGLLADEDLSVGHVLHRSRRTAGGARSQCESARVLPFRGAPARGRGSRAARTLATSHQRVDRCLRAGAVGNGPKEVESLAWRQLKPTVLAWETQTGDPARPIDVEAHTVSADSSQLTPQSLAHLGGAPHRPTRWHETLYILAVTCGH